MSFSGWKLWKSAAAVTSPVTLEKEKKGAPGDEEKKGSKKTEDHLLKISPQPKNQQTYPDLFAPSPAEKSFSHPAAAGSTSRPFEFDEPLKELADEGTTPDYLDEQGVLDEHFAGEACHAATRAVSALSTGEDGWNSDESHLTIVRVSQLPGPLAQASDDSLLSLPSRSGVVEEDEAEYEELYRRDHNPVGVSPRQPNAGTWYEPVLLQDGSPAEVIVETKQKINLDKEGLVGTPELKPVRRPVKLNSPSGVKAEKTYIRHEGEPMESPRLKLMKRSGKSISTPTKQAPLATSAQGKKSSTSRLVCDELPSNTDALLSPRDDEEGYSTSPESSTLARVRPQQPAGQTCLPKSKSKEFVSSLELTSPPSSISSFGSSPPLLPSSSGAEVERKMGTKRNSMTFKGPYISTPDSPSQSVIKGIFETTEVGESRFGRGRGTLVSPRGSTVTLSKASEKPNFQPSSVDWLELVKQDRTGKGRMCRDIGERTLEVDWLELAEQEMNARNTGDETKKAKTEAARKREATKKRKAPLEVEGQKEAPQIAEIHKSLAQPRVAADAPLGARTQDQRAQTTSHSDLRARTRLTPGTLPVGAGSNRNDINSKRASQKSPNSLSLTNTEVASPTRSLLGVHDATGITKSGPTFDSRYMRNRSVAFRQANSGQTLTPILSTSSNTSLPAMVRTAPMARSSSLPFIEQQVVSATPQPTSLEAASMTKSKIPTPRPVLKAHGTTGSAVVPPSMSTTSLKPQSTNSTPPQSPATEAEWRQRRKELARATLVPFMQRGADTHNGHLNQKSHEILRTLAPGSRGSLTSKQGGTRANIPVTNSHLRTSIDQKRSRVSPPQASTSVANTKRHDNTSIPQSPTIESKWKAKRRELARSSSVPFMQPGADPHDGYLNKKSREMSWTLAPGTTSHSASSMPRPRSTKMNLPISSSPLRNSTTSLPVPSPSVRTSSTSKPPSTSTDSRTPITEAEWMVRRRDLAKASSVPCIQQGRPRAPHEVALPPRSGPNSTHSESLKQPASSHSVAYPPAPTYQPPSIPHDIRPGSTRPRSGISNQESIPESPTTEVEWKYKRRLLARSSSVPFMQPGADTYGGYLNQISRDMRVTLAVSPRKHRSGATPLNKQSRGSSLGGVERGTLASNGDGLPGGSASWERPTSGGRVPSSLVVPGPSRNASSPVTSTPLLSPLDGIPSTPVLGVQRPSTSGLPTGTLSTQPTPLSQLPLDPTDTNYGASSHKGVKYRGAICKLPPGPKPDNQRRIWITENEHIRLPLDHDVDGEGKVKTRGIGEVGRNHSHSGSPKKPGEDVSESKEEEERGPQTSCNGEGGDDCSDDSSDDDDYVPSSDDDEEDDSDDSGYLVDSYGDSDNPSVSSSNASYDLSTPLPVPTFLRSIPPSSLLSNEVDGVKREKGELEKREEEIRRDQEEWAKMWEDHKEERGRKLRDIIEKLEGKRRMEAENVGENDNKVTEVEDEDGNQEVVNGTYAEEQVQQRKAFSPILENEEEYHTNTEAILIPSSKDRKQLFDKDTLSVNKHIDNPLSIHEMDAPPNSHSLLTAVFHGDDSDLSEWEAELETMIGTNTDPALLPDLEAMREDAKEVRKKQNERRSLFGQKQQANLEVSEDEDEDLSNWEQQLQIMVEKNKDPDLEEALQGMVSEANVRRDKRNIMIEAKRRREAEVMGETEKEADQGAPEADARECERHVQEQMDSNPPPGEEVQSVEKSEEEVSDGIRSGRDDNVAHMVSIREQAHDPPINGDPRILIFLPRPPSPKVAKPKPDSDDFSIANENPSPTANLTELAEPFQSVESNIKFKEKYEQAGSDPEDLTMSVSTTAEQFAELDVTYLLNPEQVVPDPEDPTKSISTLSEQFTDYEEFMDTEYVTDPPPGSQPMWTDDFFDHSILSSKQPSPTGSECNILLLKESKLESSKRRGSLTEQLTDSRPPSASDSADGWIGELFDGLYQSGTLPSPTALALEEESVIGEYPQQDPQHEEDSVRAGHPEQDPQENLQAIDSFTEEEQPGEDAEKLSTKSLPSLGDLTVRRSEGDSMPPVETLETVPASPSTVLSRGPPPITLQNSRFATKPVQNNDNTPNIPIVDPFPARLSPTPKPPPVHSRPTRIVRPKSTTNPKDPDQYADGGFYHPPSCPSSNPNIPYFETIFFFILAPYLWTFSHPSQLLLHPELLRDLELALQIALHGDLVADVETVVQGEYVGGRWNIAWRGWLMGWWKELRVNAGLGDTELWLPAVGGGKGVWWQEWERLDTVPGFLMGEGKMGTMEEVREEHEGEEEETF